MVAGSVVPHPVKKDWADYGRLRSGDARVVRTHNHLYIGAHNGQVNFIFFAVAVREFVLYGDGFFDAGASSTEFTTDNNPSVIITRCTRLRNELRE